MSQCHNIQKIKENIQKERARALGCRAQGAGCCELCGLAAGRAVRASGPGGLEEVGGPPEAQR